jgi:hypothetical protein
MLKSLRPGILLVITGPLLLTGCYRYIDLVDVCYPERYSAMARQEVIAAFAPQVNNGHILDQTMWNYHFETGSDELNPAGLEHLDYIVRRRPQPDPRIFLQTARDLKYNPAAPEEYVNKRQELDAKRVTTIQRYLTAQLAGRPMTFEVLVHDPQPTGFSAQEAVLAVSRQRTGAQGGIGLGLAGAGGAFGGGVGGAGGFGGVGVGAGGGGFGGAAGQPGGGGAPPR